jgi:GNAT superfamily N-acetyltransferase
MGKNDVQAALDGRAVKARFVRSGSRITMFIDGREHGFELVDRRQIPPAAQAASGSLVSSCTLTVIPNLTRACRPYGVIENVVTHAQYRGQGWGKALLTHALGEAWRQNCYKVMLLTGRKDEATLRFYEQAGFDRHDKQAFVAKPRTREE